MAKEGKAEECFKQIGIFGLGGALLGLGISLLLFKTRGPSTFYGTGFGLGVSYVECEKLYKDPVDQSLKLTNKLD